MWELRDMPVKQLRVRLLEVGQNLPRAGHLSAAETRAA